MSRIQDQIEVDAPISTVYNQWTQFESFPQFMEGVEHVEQLDDSMLEWTAEIGGQTRSWRARITEQVPDQRIAWVSTSGARNDGMVAFEPLGPGRTRVDLVLDIEPQGPAETIGDALGIVKGRVSGDLERFKAFIERRGVETGAWRGTIDTGVTAPAETTPGVDPVGRAGAEGATTHAEPGGLSGVRGRSTD